MQSKIESLFNKFHFQGSSESLLQYWNLRRAPYKYLTVMDQPFRSTQDHEGLRNYREGCILNNCYLKGPEQDDGIYSFVRKAARTGVAEEQNSYTDDQTFMGQLAVPVYDDAVLVGVIELLTIIPKQSYAKDFNRISKLLQKENLATRGVSTSRSSYNCFSKCLES